MEKYKEELNVINKLIDDSAKNLVGILLKRVEVLSKENVLTPNLYKAIAREIIYEQSRNLKRLVNVHLTIGKVKFVNPKDK
jgi:hypothetical protein